MSGFNGKRLPHIDNLVNLVVIEGEGVSRAEAMRVLAPRGIALIRRGGSWTRAVKPVPTIHTLEYLDLRERSALIPSTANFCIPFPK